MLESFKKAWALSVSGAGFGFWILVWFSSIALIKLATDVKDGHTGHVIAISAVLVFSWLLAIILGIRNRRRGCQRESGARILDFETKNMTGNRRERAS